MFVPDAIYMEDGIENYELGKELLEKYNKQLELYEMALEQSLNKKVSKKYIYSTHLNKEILLK